MITTLLLINTMRELLYNRVVRLLQSTSGYIKNMYIYIYIYIAWPQHKNVWEGDPIASVQVNNR